MPDVVASKAQSQLCELSRSTYGFDTQEISMVGGYTEKHKTVKIGGWALARDNTVGVPTICTRTPAPPIAGWWKREGSRKQRLRNIALSR